MATMATTWVIQHPHYTFEAERLGAALAEARNRGLKRIVMAGGMQRPNFKLSRLDWRTIKLAPKIIKGLSQGDDGSLRIFMRLLEDEGFEMISAQDILPNLCPKAGQLTNFKPKRQDQKDARFGQNILNQLSSFDLMQACLVAQGRCLAIEDYFGTDAMLDYAIKHAPFAGKRGGVLVKLPKIGQDHRADLPSIGVQTIEKLAQTRLAGVVVQANACLLIERKELINAANTHGLFVWSLDPQ